jgi:hypothetical protein
MDIRSYFLMVDFFLSIKNPVNLGESVSQKIKYSWLFNDFRNAKESAIPVWSVA